MNKKNLNNTRYACESCGEEIKYINQCTWIRIRYTLEKYNTPQFTPKTKNLIKQPPLIQIGAPICKQCIKNNKQITKALNSKNTQTKNYKKILLNKINEITNQKIN